MLGYLKTATLSNVQNKGQRQVIVDILAKLTTPINAEDLTKKVIATGRYHGKGTKAHVNKWAMEKAGGDLGSVKYHLRHLVADGRVKEMNLEAKAKRAKKAEVQPVTPAPAAESVAQQPAA